MKRTLEEVIRKAIDYRLASLRVALPGQVVSYDAAAQTAEIQPMIDSVIETDDGLLTEQLPSIPSVSVAHLAGGGFFVAVPLAKGDTGILIFSDFSLDYWRSNGNRATPVDLRTHSLANAVFYPGVHDDRTPLSGASASDMVVGHKSGQFILMGTGASDFVALASSVASELGKIKSALSGLAVTVPSGGGPNIPVISTSPYSSVGTVAATVLKAL